MLIVGQIVAGLAGTYRCDAKHGEGGFGIAFRGIRQSDNAPVVLKELRIERLKEWKSVELFEREAGVLRKLDHPRIPAYYDFFAWDGEKALPAAGVSGHGAFGPVSLVLVQGCVDGESLAARIEAGAHFTPADAERLLRGLLGILRYLHELHPPVIHRDINPSNVLTGNDGEPHLVDFGGVQDRLRLASLGSTQIGTVGYMPLEQLAGNSRPSTDLYALGMTMLSALSRLAPHEMPIDDDTAKVKVRDVVPTLGGQLCKAIEVMLEPLPAKRAKSAAEVLAILDGRRGAPDRRAFVVVGALACALGGTAYVMSPPRPVVVPDGHGLRSEDAQVKAEAPDSSAAPPEERTTPRTTLPLRILPDGRAPKRLRGDPRRIVDCTNHMTWTPPKGWSVVRNGGSVVASAPKSDAALIRVGTRFGSRKGGKVSSDAKEVLDQWLPEVRVTLRDREPRRSDATHAKVIAEGTSNDAVTIEVREELEDGDYLVTLWLAAAVGEDTAGALASMHASMESQERLALSLLSDCR